MIKSPISNFNYQEFDFSSYLAYKREGFIGRKWFFLELESIFEDNRRIGGVLITGEPGSGKSALISQLLCSPFSNLLIHNNTIGYHLCEYSEKGKRDGARFVRNLVDQIATQLPEYAEHVINNEKLRTELDARCHKDPTGCFFTTIVGPLRRIKQPDGFRFVIIDALDECFDKDMKTSEIMDILNSKILHFPKWLKLVLTSRNLTAVTSKLPRTINRTSLNATDKRNENDIRHYVSRFISQNSGFLDRLLTAMNVRSRTVGIKMFLDEMITRTEGNFLFVKVILQYMNDTDGKVDFHSLPTNLFDLYATFFDRQFGKNGFGPFRYLFEVLLAVYTPLQSQDVEEILYSEYKTSDFPELIEQVSCFLRFGCDGTVRIYHKSFAEWLIGQTHVLSINKTRGHHSIAKFLLRRFRKRPENVTFAHLTELFLHILSGKDVEMQETAIKLFNITKMREPQSNMTILHHLVTKPSIYLPVLNFFLQKFQTVDILDAKNKTPAFYAASEGLVESLQSCINSGADVKSSLEGYTDFDPVSAVVRNARIEAFSLTHLAAAKGHTGVVELLIRRNANFHDSNKNSPTPLHLAAGNGHLEVVKLFYHYNATFDQIILHHAAARNHFAVVEFLLSTVGLRDTCLQCQTENAGQLSLKTTIQRIHSYFCETALHAAVSRGLVDIAKLLLEFGSEALECRHHSGKTVLMDAVERNDTRMVDVLLEHGANITTVCGQRILEESNKQICSTYSMYKEDFLYTMYCANNSCECGNSALHLSAKFGIWTMAEKLTRGRIDILLSLVNCNNSSSVTVAVENDHADFLQSFNTSLNGIGRYVISAKMVATAAEYCSANVLKLFLNYPVNDQDENVWNVLRRTVRWSPCHELQKNKTTHCLGAFRFSNLSEEEKVKEEMERRLNIIKLLIGAHQQNSVLLYKKNVNGWTLLHDAALFGFEDAVKYLDELGVDKHLKDENGNTALMMALKSTPVNHLNSNASYRCYTTDDGKFSSCNTTCYDETARYLIQSQSSSISKCDRESVFMLKVAIVKRMPMSLYALFKIGVDLNCQFDEFDSPMLLHFLVGGNEVSEIFKIFEVDVAVQCGVPFLQSELHQMSYLSTDSFAIFIQLSLNKISPLQRLVERHPKGVHILDECYDAEGFLPIHRAAQGGNLAAIKWFKKIGVNLQLKTRKSVLKTQRSLTALDISILYLRENDQALILSLSSDVLGKNSGYRIECFEELLRTFYHTSQKYYSSDFPHHSILHLAASAGLDVLMDVYSKIIEIIPALKENKFLVLDEQDVDGQTPLHIAARGGFDDVVKYLVRLGADINIKDNNGDSPLTTALQFSSSHFVRLNLNYQCYTTNDGMFTSCETTPHDEIVRYLIWLQKSSISKCDAVSAHLLNQVIRNRMPLSLYTLINIGVDINCKENEHLSPFLQHIREGDQQLSEVFKRFDVDVSVECGKSFISSWLHLISYKSVIEDLGNFFISSVNTRFSLQRLIDRHPRGVRVLDECFDAEGFLPIHRASQGGNLAAIKWFKSIGVNTQLKTRSGLTSLDISILYLGNVYYGQLVAPLKIYRYLYKNYLMVPATTSKYQNLVFEELLRTFFHTTPEYRSEYPCGPALEGLSPLHMAAVKGLTVLQYVHEKASEIFPSLPINCVNKHRLDPVYLAFFYDSVRNEGLIEKYSGENSPDFFLEDIFLSNFEEKIKNLQETDFGNIDKEFSQGSVPAFQNPDHEVDFMMAFNFLYHPHPVETTEELLLGTAWNIRAIDCSGYYDNLPNSKKTESLEDYSFDSSECSKIRVRHDYYWSLCMRELTENYAQKHDCPQMLERLQSWFTWHRVRNRQLSSFIAERLGWSDFSEVTTISSRWPFYFLHKKLLNEYDAYDYLMMLNVALQVTDIRFDTRDIYNFHIGS